MNSQPLTDLDIGFVGVHELIEKGPGINQLKPAGLKIQDLNQTKASKNLKSLDPILDPIRLTGSLAVHRSLERTSNNSWPVPSCKQQTFIKCKRSYGKNKREKENL